MPIYLQHGNLIDYVPPTDTSTEDVVFMGGLVGIPQAFIPAGELGALSVDGVYMFTKKDGVSVNLGDVVKYCGTTKLAQDINADLTLGVAVAKAEADSLGVKVKINSVLPTDGGGGGSGDGGLENLATGTDALSILGEATTSNYSTSVGYKANASSNRSTAIGYLANAKGSDSIALGPEARTSHYDSTALGYNANTGGISATALGANANAGLSFATSVGYKANASDLGVTALSAWNDGGSAKTQLYLIGAGSTLSTTYCCGEAGLGFVFEDSDGEIVKRGTIKLSALMTENTDTFEPSDW